LAKSNIEWFVPLPVKLSLDRTPTLNKKIFWDETIWVLTIPQRESGNFSDRGDYDTDPFSDDLLVRILKAEAHERYKYFPLFLLFGRTGMRPGEALPCAGRPRLHKP